MRSGGGLGQEQLYQICGIDIGCLLCLQLLVYAASRHLAFSCCCYIRISRHLAYKSESAYVQHSGWISSVYHCRFKPYFPYLVTQTQLYEFRDAETWLNFYRSQHVLSHLKITHKGTDTSEMQLINLNIYFLERQPKIATLLLSIMYL